MYLGFLKEIFQDPMILPGNLSNNPERILPKISPGIPPGFLSGVPQSVATNIFPGIHPWISPVIS